MKTSLGPRANNQNGGGLKTFSCCSLFLLHFALIKGRTLEGKKLQQIENEEKKKGTRRR